MMLRVVLHRLLVSVPLLFVVSALSFVLASIAPGDPALEILGINATPEGYEQLRERLGFDQPVFEQYWHWLVNALHGDLGRSVFSDETVTSLLNSRLPVTLCLIIGSLIVSVVFGVGLGVFSAVRGGIAGRAVDAFALVGFALPAYWVAAELIVLFAVKNRWFPATGYVTFGDSPTEWAHSLVLPVTALAIGGIAGIAKQTRASMLDVLGSEHIRMAWANGLPARSVIYRHALKNAGLPIVTVVGLHAISLLGGTVLVETVFSIPGLGGLAVTATTRHDLPVIQGIAVYFMILVVVINLLVDVTYGWLNPRVQAG
jgi:peptide/nickel transport system permease protein